MHKAYLPITTTEPGITRAELNGSLYKRDGLLYRSSIQLTVAESE
jgi:hypothetical protein